MAEIARKEGVLALGQEASKPGTPFFLQKGILLIVDGLGPMMVAEILRSFIISSHYQGAELLKRIIMMNGVLSIAAGENPGRITEKLLALMGEQFYEEASAYISKTRKDEMKEYFADMETETYPDGTNLLEEVFSKLSDRDIQLILRVTDEYTYQLAFRGSSKKIQRRLCDNVSVRIAHRMVTVSIKEPVPAADEIIRAQQAMLNTLEQMRTGGEIFA
jgi:flagellar motor switch protein FliG